MPQGTLLGLLVLATTGIQGIKDLMIAYAYGTTPAADAFQFSYNFLFNIQSVFSSAMITALIPVYISVSQRSGSESAWAVTVLVARRSTYALGIIGAAAWLLFPVIIGTVSGFSADTRAQSITSLDFMLPGLIFGGVAAVFLAAVNAEGRNAFVSAFPSLAAIPVLLMAAVIHLGDAAPKAIYLAWATLGAALLQSAVLYGLLRASRHGKRVDKALIDPEATKRVQNLFLSMVVGSLLFSLTIQVNQYAAANTGPGALATLVNGQKVVAFVAGVASSFISIVFLPRFSYLVAAREKTRIRRELWRVAGWAAVLGVLSVVVVSLAPKSIVELLFQHGRFDAKDTANVAVVLQLAIFQLPFFLVGQVLNQFLLAHHQHKMLTLAVLVMATVCIPTAFVLSSSFGLAGVAVNGALTYAITSVCLLVFVVRHLRAGRTSA